MSARREASGGPRTNSALIMIIALALSIAAVWFTTRQPPPSGVRRACVRDTVGSSS